MPPQPNLSPWISSGPAKSVGPVKGAPARPGDTGAAMSHRQYAGYMDDRSSRFYARGLRRRGFDFGDPFLFVLLADSAWRCDDSADCDGLPCPDVWGYP
jgi:hypothetical protein